jgi:hypothetical protein
VSVGRLGRAVGVDAARDEGHGQASCTTSGGGAKDVGVRWWGRGLVAAAAFERLLNIWAVPIQSF